MSMQTVERSRLGNALSLKLRVPTTKQFEFPVATTEGQFPDITIPIKSDSDRSQYLEYVDWLVRDAIQERGYAPQKLLAQQLLQTEGLGDPDTILIAAKEEAAQSYVVESFIKQGRNPVWIGTCIRNDITEPQVTYHDREHAAFWKGIRTMEDWKALQPAVRTYAQKHPELILKIFPQDGKYSNSRLLVDNQEVAVYCKLNEMDAREEVLAKEEIDISIKNAPLSDSPRKINVLSNSEKSRDFLQLLNHHSSQQSFEILQNALWKISPNLSFINPEFMCDIKNGKIAFFIDLVWGMKPEAKTDELLHIVDQLSIAAIAPIKIEKKTTNKDPAMEAANKRIMNQEQEDKTADLLAALSLLTYASQAEINSLREGD